MYFVARMLSFGDEISHFKCFVELLKAQESADHVAEDALLDDNETADQG